MTKLEIVGAGMPTIPTMSTKAYSICVGFGHEQAMAFDYGESNCEKLSRTPSGLDWYVQEERSHERGAMKIA